MDFRVVGAGVYAVKVLETWVLQTEGNPFVTIHSVDLEGFRVHFSCSFGHRCSAPDLQRKRALCPKPRRPKHLFVSLLVLRLP